MKGDRIMAHARTASRNTYLSWVKPKFLALLVAVPTTTFALISGASAAIPVILKMLNVPDCLTYANVYRGTQSDFKKEDGVWREYAPNAATYSYEFNELKRTRDEIILRNVTPREGVADWATLVVHLPVCGGTVKLTEGLPERSTDLEQIWRAK
jgi:hypothetical protein